MRCAVMYASWTTVPSELNVTQAEEHGTPLRAVVVARDAPRQRPSGAISPPIAEQDTCLLASTGSACCVTDVEEAISDDLVSEAGSLVHAESPIVVSISAPPTALRTDRASHVATMQQQDTQPYPTR